MFNSGIAYIPHPGFGIQVNVVLRWGDVVVRKSLIALACLAAVGSAQAEPQKQGSWTGFYAGVHGAYSSGQNDWTGDYVPNAGASLSEINFAAGSPNFVGSYDLDGWSGGLQIGADMQLDNTIVVGVVADSSWGDISGDGPIPNSVSRAKGDIDWLGSLRARIGYAMPDMLVYATVGGAMANGSSTIAPLNSARGDVTVDADYKGYVYGGGVEIPLFDGFTLQAEYLRYELDADTSDFGTINSGRLQLYGDGEVTLNMFKAGVNYRF